MFSYSYVYFCRLLTWLIALDRVLLSALFLPLICASTLRPFLFFRAKCLLCILRSAGCVEWRLQRRMLPSTSRVDGAGRGKSNSFLSFCFFCFINNTQSLLAFFSLLQPKEMLRNFSSFSRFPSELELAACSFRHAHTNESLQIKYFTCNWLMLSQQFLVYVSINFPILCTTLFLLFCVCLLFPGFVASFISFHSFRTFNGKSKNIVWENCCVCNKSQIFY